jgi:hypothetical protein
MHCIVSRCRVQFDRRELGVELVKDVDVMPIDPLDSLPPTLLSASGHLLLNGRRATNGVPQVPTVHPPAVGRHPQTRHYICAHAPLQIGGGV